MSIPTYEETAVAINRFHAECGGDYECGVFRFMERVNPLPENIDKLTVPCFDYLLWDFEYEPGRTVALDMAENDHSLDDWARAKYTRLIPDFFANGEQHFTDAFDGTHYVLKDPAIRPHWDEGSLGCRIALDDDGYWRTVGMVLLHDNSQFSHEVYPYRVSMADDLRHILGGDWEVISTSY